MQEVIHRGPEALRQMQGLGLRRRGRRDKRGREALSRRLAEGPSDLRSEFEMIIIDEPPVMPVVDARILAEQSHQVVLVSRWQRTPSALVRRAGELLALSGAQMAGLVVNDVGADALPADTAYMLSGYGEGAGLSDAA